MFLSINIRNTAFQYAAKFDDTITGGIVLNYLCFCRESWIWAAKPSVNLDVTFTDRAGTQITDLTDVEGNHAKTNREDGCETLKHNRKHTCISLFLRSRLGVHAFRKYFLREWFNPYLTNYRVRHYGILFSLKSPPHIRCINFYTMLHSRIHFAEDLGRQGQYQLCYHLLLKWFQGIALL